MFVVYTIFVLMAVVKCCFLLAVASVCAIVYPGYTMAFISVVTRNIIRQECKWHKSLKLVRQLSTAESSLTGKAEDTRHYVPRSVFYYLRSDYLGNCLFVLGYNLLQLILAVHS